MNTSSIDLYAVLGVPTDADLAAIRKAFRACMRQTHPDGRSSEEAAVAHEEMVLLNLAYETLKDPGKRAVYDLDRRTAGNAKREQHREPTSPPTPQPRVIVVDPEVADFGSVAIGETCDRVVTVRLSDNSTIRYAWALNDYGDFWQVVEPRPYRDVSAVRLRLRVRPLSAHDELGPRSDRLRIMVDDLVVVVPVSIAVVAAPPPPPPAPPPKPRVIVLNPRRINFGSLWPGMKTQEQVVVEASFDDGSPISSARVLNPTGAFWHVTSEAAVGGTTRFIVRIQRGPVAPDQPRRQLTEQVQICLDGVIETVWVTAFITAPPAPRLTLANWRDFRLTLLGWFMLLSLLLLLGSIAFSGVYALLNAAPCDSGTSRRPPMSGIAALQDQPTSAPQSAVDAILWSVPQAGDSASGLPPTVPAVVIVSRNVT
ncbi:J domain-containing protein [Streptomyces xylophagus]|uniref:J domain-containing protein n=1 Tax=Streptomyces xylophagus TaxID=285514 RepID=UPI0006903B32|nr:J domain-containing protein [Streptomyces xylophagus]